MGMLSLATRGLKAIDQEAMASPYDRSSTYRIDPVPRWSGLGVSPEFAYNIVTIYQCVRVLAETFAAMPLIVYRKLPGGGKERAEDHPLYDVLHRRPNPDMSSFVWRELLMSHVATWGNAYNEIQLDRAGRPSLWPVRPDRLEPFYYNARLIEESPWRNLYIGKKGYWYLSPRDGKLELNPDSILHVQGLSSNGLVGLSPISVLRSTIRLYETAERFGTSFFDNDARPGTILSHPKTLSAPAIERLRNQMESLKGSQNAGKSVILEEGLTVSEVGIHPEDAQFMETRLFQKRELAAAYRIQPHKVGDLERATFSNIEHLSIEFIQDTMLPWFVRSEQEFEAELLTGQEQRTHAIEFLVDGYLRGDAKARAEALAIRWQHGTLSADEWREKENENPIADNAGKSYFVPVNYQPAERALAEPEPAQEPNLNAGNLELLAGGATRSLAQFDCPSCGKLINRLAVPGTVGYCRGCRAERTMVS